MISFWIALRNPFPCQAFNNIKVYNGKITKHKAWEIQFSRYTFNWLEFKLDLNWRQTDHAGPWLTVNLFGFTMDMRMYDIRHWNDATNTWGEYNGQPD
jgi:hypothetical protein